MNKAKEIALERTCRNWKIFVICLIIIAWFSISYGAFNKGRIDSCIDACAEKVVMTLEMVTACMDLSNITSEQLTERYIDMFVLRKELEGEKHG